VERVYNDQDAFHQTLQVDTTAEIPGFAGQLITANDAYDLVEAIGSSQQGKACFSRKMFRFFKERRETQEDNCQINGMYEELNKPNGNLFEGFVNMIANESNKRKQK
ncbi:MAG: DUF1585 domain-containing protein, partial [Pseudomonadota bacterium]